MVHYKHYAQKHNITFQYKNQLQINITCILCISGCVTNDEEIVPRDDFSVYGGYGSEETSNCDECLSTDQEHWDDDDIE